jgi:MFS superfamily sulfate permease-like transporter
VDSFLAAIDSIMGLFDSISQMDIIALVLLVVVGLIIIVIIRLLTMVIPAALLALVVWFFTGSIFWSGVTFLIVASFSFLKKL